MFLEHLEKNYFSIDCNQVCSGIAEVRSIANPNINAPKEKRKGKKRGYAGLPIMVCEEAVLNSEDGQELEVNLETGAINNLTTGQTFQAEPLDPFVARIVAAGGIINYIEMEGTLR